MSLVNNSENSTISDGNLGGFYLEENEIILYYLLFIPLFLPNLVQSCINQY